MQTPSARYAILTAARNEARHMEKVIDAVALQSVLPVRWVIVDDGSQDGTGDVVRQAGKELSCLICLTRQAVGPVRNFQSKANALQLAWQRVAGETFDYVGVLDADMVPPPDYYERIIAMFKENPGLGIAGGWILEEQNSVFRARKSNRQRSINGGCQVFRRDCYEAIGGVPALQYGGEDTLAEIRAEMHGWTIRASSDLPLRHLRPAGSSQHGRLRSAILEGKRDYHLGYHPLFSVAKAIRRVPERPVLIRSLCRFYGCLACALRSEPRDVSGEEMRHLRARQMDVSTRPFLGTLRRRAG